MLVDPVNNDRRRLLLGRVGRSAETSQKVARGRGDRRTIRPARDAAGGMIRHAQFYSGAVKMESDKAP